MSRSSPDSIEAAAAASDGVSVAPVPSALLAFRVRDHRYAVDLAQVVEVVRMVAPTRISGVSPDVLGVIDCRGSVVPLFDPAVALGLSVHAPTLESKVVIGRAGEKPIALMVDEIDGLLDVAPSEYQPRAALLSDERANAQSCVLATVRKPEGLTLVLDLAQFLRHRKLARVATPLAAPAPKKSEGSAT
jgi:purine-binding chemotaxis protein CheW